MDMETLVRTIVRAELADALSECGPQSREDTYLTVAETAQYISMSISWLEVQRRDGKGPTFIKVGKRVLYRKSDLDDWMARRAS